jgi:hypothetical protein
MCTLTIVPWHPHGPQSPGVRIVCNRDESVLRPAARPPELRSLGQRKMLAPIDPVADGTWIGVSDAPLAGILMNVYIAQAEPDVIPLATEIPGRVPISRGTIIPRILAAADLTHALALADKLEVARFEPFRLVLVDRERCAEIVWAAEQFSIGKPQIVTEPQFFTSSGLGDDVVAKPRRELFEERFVADRDWVVAQDSFHRHVWPGCEFASVWMTRREARTQSITWVEIRPESAEMRYAARQGASDEIVFAPAITLQLSPQ